MSSYSIIGDLGVTQEFDIKCTSNCSSATYETILGVCRELRVSRHQFERGCRWNRAIRSSGRRLLEPCPR
jgi:hypothetical protein